jgi:hypothetical protein
MRAAQDGELGMPAAKKKVSVTMDRTLLREVDRWLDR